MRERTCVMYPSASSPEALSSSATCACTCSFATKSKKGQAEDQTLA